MTIFLGVAAVLFCLQAVACDDTVLNKFLMTAMSSVDVDGDGIVTTSELQKNMLLRYDTNKDGAVSQKEFVVQWDLNFDGQHSAGVNVFGQVDSNSDGSWTLADFTALSKGMDQNKDGSATVTEFVATVAGAFKAAGFVLPDSVVVG